MDEERLKKAIELARIATEKDAEGDYDSAFQYYKSSLDHWQLVCKYQTNPALKGKLYEKMEPYLVRAEAIKEYLEKKKKQVSVVSNETTDSTNENDAIKRAFEHLITQERPTTKWTDVAGLETAKAALQEAVVLPTRFPDLFKGKRQPWRGILLYGPPGTGKTHLAKACASETSAVFYSVSSADIISKWQGESEKLVRSLFESAAQNAPAIVFVDEVDSLCGARSDRDSESSRRVKTEFLVQMEGLGQKSSRVLVLGATNEPWSLDAAIRRRFERRIYIGLPDANARAQLIKLHVGDTPHELVDEDFDQIAINTDGFSGADISVLVRNALFEPIRKCQVATHFKRIKQGQNLKWIPCLASDPDPTKTQLSLMDILPDELASMDLSRDDLRNALLDMKPTVAPRELNRYTQWTQEFGIEGN